MTRRFLQSELRQARSAPGQAAWNHEAGVPAWLGWF